MSKKIAETPLMLQYLEMKKKHPDAILLFRVGDFYETFSDDAIAASEILGITLTRRANGKAASVELAGFPHHALDTYLPKLVRAGKRVAICEQLEDPKLTKKLVKRGITELITPGVNLNDNSLSPRENNYLAAIHIGRNIVGVAFLDISTGEFLCAEGEADYVDKLLGNIAPKELLRMHGTRQYCDDNFTFRTSTFELDDWVYTSDAATERLLRHFGTTSLKGFGLDNMNAAVIAAGSILYYLDITKHTRISHITTLGRIDRTRFVHLDPFTFRNLELVTPLSADGLSLLKVLDKSITPAGARKLANWIKFPLVDIESIRMRQQAVSALAADSDLNSRVAESLRVIGDLERTASKLSTGRIGPRDMVTLAHSLRSTMHLADILRASGNPRLAEIATAIPDTSTAADLILRTILPDAPVAVNKGSFIAPGVSAELDELTRLHRNSRQALDEMLAREIANTGISSLKIAYNNVFGYYIEVRNTHRDKVPEQWIRKQTLVNAERYVTPELKEYEEKILTAGDRIQAIHTEIFARLIATVGEMIGDIRTAAMTAAECDVYYALATAAVQYNYVCPEINDSLALSITDGRHPVIERKLPPDQPYISNSLSLDSDNRQIMMITGPNMSGKSALLRSVALITLMAQIGSFVPASAASIGIVDKIFSRVGASDNISSGESTFMVEMNEAASILNNMSQRSLILFDELGRGTSTYDGISIAWAIVEHIHENGRCRPKTLFATHYHELNEMEKTFKRIANFNVSVREINGKVIFMRKLEPGGSEHSFGIHVARLAGMPPSIVRRADQVLQHLEDSAIKSESGAATRERLDTLGQHRDGYQLSLFQLDDPLLSQIRDRLLNISVDNLTPLQALTMLHDLQCLLTGKNK